jgi:hypothetical protein
LILEIAGYAIALAASAWAVWVRRATYRIPWERSTTYAIGQLALALVLISPAAEPVIGRLLYEVTGFLLFPGTSCQATSLGPSGTGCAHREFHATESSLGLHGPRLFLFYMGVAKDRRFLEETHRREIHRNLSGWHNRVIFGPGDVCKT